MSIRRRLFIGLSVIIIVAFYYFTNWLTEDIRSRYLETMEESMVETSQIFASVLESDIDNGRLSFTEFETSFTAAQKRSFEAKIYNHRKTDIGLDVYITNSDGIVIFDSRDNGSVGKNYSLWNDVLLTLRGEYGARATRVNPEDPTTASLYIGAPIRSDGNVIGCVTVIKPVKNIDEFLIQAKNKIVFGAVIVFGVMAILIYLISLWVTQPIRSLTHYARTVSEGRRVKFPKLGNSEIGEFGDAFEKMRETLEGKQYVETYIQNLTHELKSPLSSIRGAAELLGEQMSVEQRERFIQNIQGETERMQNIVDRLLELAALENKSGLSDLQRIDVSGLVEDILDGLAPMIDQKSIKLKVDVEKGIVIESERFLLRQSIVNVLVNAIEFSSYGGEITLSASADDDFLKIVLQDEGPGMPVFALEKVYDRFFSLPRPDSGKKSSGLGLAFVHEVVSLHNGEVAIENISPHGVRSTLRLPLRYRDC